MIKVCHVTSVHPKEDVRIFQKECVSLAKAGYEVYLVQRGESYEKGGVHLIGFGEIAPSRLRRMLVTARCAYQKALEVNADIYHLHDPELLPYGMKLKRAGKKVIFDSHEDVPADIQGKYWIPAFLRSPISRIYSRFENRCCAKLDGVVSVTPHLCDRLREVCSKVEMITNYPILETELPQPEFQNRKLIFPGIISGGWHLETILPVLHSIEDVTLELRSRNVQQSFFNTLKQLPGWEKVHFPGEAPHDEIMRLMTECNCGMALCEPCANTGWKLGTLGNTKIFEYMMAGIPVVCTDFVLWREIVDRYHCGICVDPENVDQIAAAIRYLLDNPEQARQMGENGRRAVQEEFNWGVEEKKLLALYEDILKK